VLFLLFSQLFQIAVLGLKYNIIFVGPHKSGKTKIIHAIEHESFNLDENAYLPTFGIDYFQLNKKVGLLDTSGNERYKTIVNPYIENEDNSDAFVICVDVDNVECFDKVCREYLDLIKNKDGTKKIVLVITKVDSEEEKQKIPKDIETQIKTSFHGAISEVFFISLKDGSPFRSEVNKLKEWAIKISEEDETIKKIDKEIVKKDKTINKINEKTIDEVDEEGKAKNFLSKIDKKRALLGTGIVGAVVCYCLRDKLGGLFRSNQLKKSDKLEKIKNTK